MTIPSSEQALLDHWRSLHPEQKEAALAFVEFLHSKNAPKRARRSLLGLCAEANVIIVNDDITEARREMWGSFPRDF